LLASFKSFTLMSACVSDSIVFHALSSHFNMVKQDLNSDREPANFSLLEIGTLTKEYDLFTQSIRKTCEFWSPNAKLNYDITHKPQEHVQWAMKQLEFDRFESEVGRLSNNGDRYMDGNNKIRLATKWSRNEPVQQKDDYFYFGTKIPINSAGSNAYDNFRGYAFVAALNASKTVNKFYEETYPNYKLGIKGSWTWVDRIGLPALQGVTRLCIRKPGNKRKCWAIFFDRRTSKYVKKKLRDEPRLIKIPGNDDYSLITPMAKVSKPIEFDTHFKNGKKKLTKEEKKAKAKEKARLRKQKQRAK
jgi:hypothetical protein